MCIGIGIGIGRSLRASGISTDQVIALFGGGVSSGGTQGILTYASPDTCFTDGTFTTPTTVNGAAGTIHQKDLSGNANHIVWSNAVLATASSGYEIKHNGSSTSGLTGTINFTGTSKIFICAGVRRVTDGTARVVAEMSANVNTNNGSFAVFAPVSTNNAGVYLRGTSGIVTNLYATATTATYIHSAQFDLDAATSAEESVVRINGVAGGTIGGGPAGSGPFGTYPFHFGRRAGSSLPFDGGLSSFVAFGGVGDVQLIESWSAGKNGVALA